MLDVSKYIGKVYFIQVDDTIFAELVLDVTEHDLTSDVFDIQILSDNGKVINFQSHKDEWFTGFEFF